MKNHVQLAGVNLEAIEVFVQSKRTANKLGFGLRLIFSSVDRLNRADIDCFRDLSGGQTHEILSVILAA